MPFPIDSIIDQIMQASDNRASGSTRDFSRIAIPKSQAEFEALPDGTYYVEPDDGQIYQKGNKRRPPPREPRGVMA